MFFFKQKTAYEMRISDWSSDVCSSDLPRQVLRHENEVTWLHLRRVLPRGDLGLYGQATKRIRWMPWQSEAMKDVAACEKCRGAEIGRASCRERVCQYV